MNTINSSVHNVAMDGQTLYKASPKAASGGTPSTSETTPLIQNGAEVAQNIEQKIAEIKESTKEIQNLSAVVNGRKLQFNVNKELGSVVVTIVDSSTNQIIKEIPSEDMQKLKIRIRKAIGSLYDNYV